MADNRPRLGRGQGSGTGYAGTTGRPFDQGTYLPFFVDCNLSPAIDGGEPVLCGESRGAQSLGTERPLVKGGVQSPAREAGVRSGAVAKQRSRKPPFTKALQQQKKSLVVTSSFFTGNTKTREAS